MYSRSSLDQPYIYKALDWGDTSKATIYTIGAFVFMFIAYFLLFCLYKCRVFIAKNQKACCDDEDADSEANQKFTLEDGVKGANHN